MRKYPQIALAWALFWTGHVVSKIQESIDREGWFDFWFPAYRWLMLTSHELDRWHVIWDARIVRLPRGDER